MQNRDREKGLPPGVEEAAAEIERGECTCVLVKDGEIVHRAEGRGVKPLLQLYKDAEGRQLLKGAAVVDKIIGKAAAMILALAGAGYVYGCTMSLAAVEYMNGLGLPHGFGKEVPRIVNRAGDGLCPIESSVLELDDAREGYERILATVEKLMAQQAPTGEKTS